MCVMTSHMTYMRKTNAGGAGERRGAEALGSTAATEQMKIFVLRARARMCVGVLLLAAILAVPLSFLLPSSVFPVPLPLRSSLILDPSWFPLHGSLLMVHAGVPLLLIWPAHDESRCVSPSSHRHVRARTHIHTHRGEKQ